MPQRSRRGEAALAALLGRTEPETSVLVADSLADDPGAWTGVRARVVPDDRLARVLRELGDRVEVLALRELDDALMRVLRDRLPGLVVVAGAPDEARFDELDALAHRHGSLVLGPSASLRFDAGSDTGPIVCAAQRDELDRLCAAIGPSYLAIAPTPIWLPHWLLGPSLLGHDVVGYVPTSALSLTWVDWLEQLRARELHQLLIPLGIASVELEPLHPALEAATVTHALERIVGPIYPAPQVLARLREGVARELGLASDSEPESTEQGPTPSDPDARALWIQARRALPSIAQIPGMQRPDPALSLTVPTAAFLAQRGLLRMRTSAELLARAFDEPDYPDPDLLDRSDTVLEGAGQVLSDHESKVVLRGHGIEITRQAFANSASGAANFADKIGYPVALKALSPGLGDKRSLGAIVLDVPNAAATKRAYADIIANVEERAPTVLLDGVTVAEMIEPGLDLRVGGLRMMSGGIALFAQPRLEGPTEPVLARSPLSAHDALLLAEAALAQVPASARRASIEPDVEILAELLLRIDGLFRHTGERLQAVDLAPVRFIDSDRRYVTLDARIVQRPHVEGS